MGYMQVTVGGSDTAADCAVGIEQKVIELLQKELDQEHDWYNTDGVINVAMILDECFMPSMFWRQQGDDFKDFADKVIEKLAKYIEKEKKSDDWVTKASKTEHLKTYRRLLKRMRIFAKDSA